MKILLFISVLAILVVSCDRAVRPPLKIEDAKNSFVGFYTGEHYGGVESLEIRSNGTFSQSFVGTNGTNFANSGTWRLEQAEDRYYVYFVPFIDLREAIAIGKPPLHAGSSSATWYDDEPIIWFDRDLSYFFTKHADLKKGIKEH